MVFSSRLFVCTFGIALSSFAHAQTRFATGIVNFTQGTGTGTFVPTNALGGPRGGGMTSGSLDVCSLGFGGALTLSFDVTLADGPGADLTVFENPITFAGQVFSEAAFVEVSTDGVHFARFPNRYAGPPTGLSGFTAPWGTYSGLTGCIPVRADVVGNSIDPLDPVVSGGEAFDLAALAPDPLVASGAVDLAAIHFVRLVDVQNGVGLDSFGNVIWDNAGAAGSADIDAVAVLNTAASITSSQPRVQVFIDAAGFLNVDVSDPDGLADIDLSTLHASFNLVPTGIARLQGLLPDVTTTPTSLHLRSALPFTGPRRRGVLSVSTRDLAGQFSAAQLILQG
jgi:hypothetical protein